MFINFLRREKGQGTVEYGLIIVLSIIVFLVIQGVNGTSENVIRESAMRNQSQNPEFLITPDKPNKEKLWEDKVVQHSEDYKFFPVAYFSIPNPIYIGEEVSYWDGSYDPDGEIVSRVWSGKQNVFNTAGTYTISLTVTDNDNQEDTYETTIRVIERNNYTKLIYDHANEQREVINQSNIYNDPTIPKTELIIDHIFGLRKDFYDVEHTVIEKNLWKYTQPKAQDITYEVTIPVYEVTYNGLGQEINRKYHSTVTQTDIRTVPQPADITTELKDNTWTFYVYNEKNSYYKVGNDPIKDYFPDKKDDGSWNNYTRQDPDFESVRKSQSNEEYSLGYDIPSSKCASCTEPNRFELKSLDQSKVNNLICSADSLSYTASKSGVTTHTRTYNWIEHKAFDWYWEYTGTADETGTETEIKTQQRGEMWTTEGWESSEMVGTGTPQDARYKYSSCSSPASTDGGTGSNNEDCWKLYTTNVSTTHSCERYGDLKSQEVSCSKNCSYIKATTTRTNCETVDGVETCDESCSTSNKSYTATGTKTQYYYDTHKRVVSCTFIGSSQSGTTSGSWSTSGCGISHDSYGDCSASCDTEDESCP